MENVNFPSPELQELKALLELQIKLTGELLRLCRHTDLSAGFAVDAVNGLYSLISQL